MTGEVIGVHVEMLNRVGLIDELAAETLTEAIQRVKENPPSGVQDPIAVTREFDERLNAHVAAAVTGVALVGRGVIDVAATVARMELRARLLVLLGDLGELRRRLLDLADGHVVSVMPVMIDGAVAQPGTIASWLGGLIAPLGRAQTELTQAFAVVNQSPLGAGSHASTGFENDRVFTAERLGFDAPLASGFDAVSAVDHFAASAGVAASVVAPIGRWLAELVVLIRTEPASLRLTDEWRRGLADMPQFDAPAGIEALAQRCETLVDRADRLRLAGMRAAYGPVAARLSGLLNETAAALDGASEIAIATEALLGGLDFNRAYLANRAGRAFSTASDLADFLMIEEQQEPGAARAIAALTISRARELGVESSGITPELIDGAALLVIGQELKVEFEAISRYLAPRRFIERRTAVGGASPASTRTYIEVEQSRLEADLAWRSSAVAAIGGVAPAE